MKYSSKRIWRMLLTVTAVLCMAAMIPLSTSATSATAQTPIEYYGRYALSQEPNAKVLLYIYDQLVEGIEGSAEEISVYDGKNAVTSQELKTAFDAYTRDHTEHFWLGNTYSYKYTSTTVLSVVPEYLLSGSSLKNAKAEYEKAINRFLVGIDDSMSDFQKELVIHDRLAQAVVYTEATNAHNSYGAIVEGKAVCEGYAEALQYLLQRVGVQSFIAVGRGIHLSTGTSEAHAWNYVRIDGKYYQTDLTWNDQSDVIYHAYFNLDDSTMSEDHVLTDTEYALPKCSSNEAQYFTVMGGKQFENSYSVDTIASRLKESGMRTNVYITGSVSGFINWMKNNIVDIAEKAGVRGKFSYSYNYLGRELFLTINADCQHTSLTYISSKSATCTEEGNQSYYICSCGKWFSDSNATAEITNYSSVMIAAKGHDYTEKINDAAHLRSSAADCQSYDTYWYDCARCTTNAKNDSAAGGMYYNGTQRGAHSYTEKINDAAHLRSSAADCQSYDTYWYDCTRCTTNAKDDSAAGGMYYNGTRRGAHLYTEKCTDLAHLVAGSGSDCKQAKRYYYDCVYCDQIGTSVWTSDSYGDHQLSDEWIFDGVSHFRQCQVSGCTHIANRSNCSGGTATCTKKAICTVCGNEYGSLSAHSYSDQWQTDQNHHWHECECHAKVDQAPHDDDNKDGKCDQCKDVMRVTPDNTTVTEKPNVPTPEPTGTSSGTTAVKPAEPSTGTTAVTPTKPTTGTSSNTPSNSPSDTSSDGSFASDANDHYNWVPIAAILLIGVAVMVFIIAVIAVTQLRRHR